MRFSAEERQRFIEFRLLWDGLINRRDLTTTFGVSVPQASNDLRAFLATFPDSLVYDPRAKTYRAGLGLRPRLNELRADAFFLHLRRLGESERSWLAEGVPFVEAPFLGRTVVAEHLRAVVTSIRERRTLRIEYQSMRRAEPETLEIEPHALGSDGFRWHARALACGEKAFRDFVLSRLLRIEDVGAAKSDSAGDLFWIDHVDVVIRANRNLRAGPRKAVEVEYGMCDGRLNVPVRIALLPYFLTEHRLDFDPDEKADRAVHRLEIENIGEVEDALRATGFVVERAGRGLRTRATF